jgi:hypothetical protein
LNKTEALGCRKNNYMIKTLSKIYFFLLAALSFASAQPAELSADNGIVKVKFDLTRGGAISYISLSNSQRNLVNIFDEGRYIQQSYYAGNSIDRKAEGQSPKWSPWCWNPIQVGDEFKNRAKILDYKQEKDSLYVKCIPMLWDMNNQPAEAEMEQQTILLGNVLKVHCKLTCHRTDNIYGEGKIVDQELPAVYPISALSNLYSYLGSKPFTNDTLSKPVVKFLQDSFWGRYAGVTEHWMAFVDSTDWGMGVYNSRCTDYLAGIAGKVGGETKDGSTSYIAPVKKEVLNKNSVYEYDYYIIIGTLKEIREKVYQLNSGRL